MMTMDMRVKKILGHQRDIQRYCRLLATDLTDLERHYLQEYFRLLTIPSSPILQAWLNTASPSSNSRCSLYRMPMRALARADVPGKDG